MANNPSSWGCKCSSCELINTPASIKSKEWLKRIREDIDNFVGLHKNSIRKLKWKVDIQPDYKMRCFVCDKEKAPLNLLVTASNKKDVLIHWDDLEISVCSEECLTFLKLELSRKD